MMPDTLVRIVMKKGGGSYAGEAGWFAELLLLRGRMSCLTILDSLSTEILCLQKIPLPVELQQIKWIGVTHSLPHLDEFLIFVEKMRHLLEWG